MSPEMWRQIIVHAAYQIIVICILMYLGVFMFFDETFNLITEPPRIYGGLPTNRLVLDTICFHSFILMNLFNMFNCRVLDQHEINVFKNIFNNIFFWLVLGIEVAVQILMINAADTQLGSALLGVAPLTKGQNVVCWFIGASSLAINIVGKQIPLSFFAFTNNIDLENENREEFINKITYKA
jgi:magnesium-transporting ATPase (P-type)